MCLHRRLQSKADQEKRAPLVVHPLRKVRIMRGMAFSANADFPVQASVGVRRADHPHLGGTAERQPPEPRTVLAHRRHVRSLRAVRIDAVLPEAPALIRAVHIHSGSTMMLRSAASTASSAMLAAWKCIFS